MYETINRARNLQHKTVPMPTLKCRNNAQHAILKNLLRRNDLQPLSARAKRQQHLPKELAFHLRVQQYPSFISGKTRTVSYETLKLCGAAAPNTAQKSNAGLSLRAEQFNHLKSENKCNALSLSLSGTASALGTL